MLMSFRCPPHVKEQIDALVRAGLYPDFNAFVVAALENLLVAEKGEAGPLWSRAGGRAGDEPLFAAPDLFDEARRVAPAPAGGLRGLERHRLADAPPVPLPEPATPPYARDAVVPLEQWLFGQYNRLLPAKVSCRALAVMLGDAGVPPPLDEAGPRIAELAARFGTRLRDLDRRHGTHRDDALATAFPEEGRDGEKGRLRYQNHFVGQLVRGALVGLPGALQLAAVEDRKHRPHLVPTTAGWEFARLANPLLDGAAGDESPERFSSEERRFLVDHIRRQVPAEAFAYRVVLTLIEQGKDTPEQLNQGVRRYFGRTLKQTAEYIATQRTGVLARAADLGLVARERQAREMTYRVMTDGVEFLAAAGRAPKNN